MIRRSGRILAAQRLPGGSAGGKWEFPGGKVEPGETAKEALVREIDEELRLEISVEKQLGRYVTVHEGRRIHLDCYWCSCSDTEPQLNAHAAAMWCVQEDMRHLDWAQADIPAVMAILSPGFDGPTA